MGRTGCPPTSLPNPRWGERVDAAEAARQRQRWHDDGRYDMTVVEGAARKRLDLIQVAVSVSFVAPLIST